MPKMDAKTRTQAETEGLQMRKIVWVTRPDRRRNVDIKKALDSDKDITKLLWMRRLACFGHVSYMPAERFPHVACLGASLDQEPEQTKKEMDGQRHLNNVIDL